MYQLVDVINKVIKNILKINNLILYVYAIFYDIFQLNMMNVPT